MVWGQHKWGASSWGVETACDIRSNIINLIILLKEREKAAATSSEGCN